MCGYPPEVYIQIREDKLYTFTETFYEFTETFYEYIKNDEMLEYLTFWLLTIIFLALMCIVIILSNLEKRVQSLEKDHPLLEPLLAV